MTTDHVLLLCHRRRDSDAEAPFADWAEGRAGRVGERGGELGAPAYLQVHRVGRWHPVHLGIRLSRSWPVAALISLLRGLRPPPWRHPDIDHDAERWDLVEVFAWREPPDLAAPSATAALAELAQDAAHAVRHTAVIACERHLTVPDPGKPEIATLFCLRPRRALEAETMRRYWLDEHGPFVAQLQAALGFAGYGQLVARDEGSVTTRDAAPPFVAVAQLNHDAMGTLVRGLFSPRTQIANLRLVWDEMGFLDPGRSALILGRVRHRRDR